MIWHMAKDTIGITGREEATEDIIMKSLRIPSRENSQNMLYITI